MKISVKEKMKEAEQMSLQYPDVLYRVMDKIRIHRQYNKSPFPTTEGGEN